MDLHGYVNITGAKSRFERCFWLAFLLAAVAACVGWSSMTLARYFDHAKTTALELVFQKERRPPEVQICGSWPPFDAESFANTNLSEAAAKSLQAMLTFNIGALSNKNATIQDWSSDQTANTELLAYFGPPENWAKVFATHAAQCSRLLQHCVVDSVTFDCCDAAYTTTVIDPLHGTCFVLRRVDSLPTITMASFLAALQFSIQPFAPWAGLPAAVNVDFADRFYSPTTSGIVLGMGEQWFVGLKMAEYSRLEPNCDKRFVGSVGQCYLAELDRIVREFCNCSFVWPNSKNALLCTPYKIDTCFRAQAVRITQMHLTDIETSCSKAPCHESVYEVASLSSVANANGSRGEANIAVYYASMSHTRYVESEAFTFDSAVSAIGGNMGLFVGASLITLVQLAVFSGATLRERLLRRRLKKLGLWGESSSEADIKRVDDSVIADGSELSITLSYNSNKQQL